MDYSPQELMIATIAGMLVGCRHVAVGVLSPIPGSAAILAQARTDARVSIIGSTHPEYRTDGGVDLFDCAGQGRIDAFFFSGGQIDGEANINLHGIPDGDGYKVRWSGAFGSAYLYFLIPRIILFREEHTRRVLVPKVDFVSAPGTSPPGIYRPGGPKAMVTNLCVMSFDQEKKRFRLEGVHPGHSVEEVLDNTGFDFDIPENVPETPAPDAETLALIRGDVARRIADPYPAFAEMVLGVGAAQPA